MNHTSFIIGRFQPFHQGHKALLQKALSVSKRVVVFIGSSLSDRTKSNPFTTEERMNLILTSFDDKEKRRLVFVPLPDYPTNDLWLNHISTSLKLINQGKGTFTFVCCDKDVETSKSNQLVTELANIDTYTVHPPLILNATDIRIDLENNKFIPSIVGLNQESFNLLGEYKKLVPHFNLKGSE